MAMVFSELTTTGSPVTDAAGESLHPVNAGERAQEASERQRKNESVRFMV
jgi:hypothetical protein